MEVGHGNRRLKKKESCLLSIIGVSGNQLDLECFCFDSFLENRVFAENWAMGLTYCIAKCKGEIANDDDEDDADNNNDKHKDKKK